MSQQIALDLSRVSGYRLTLCEVDLLLHQVLAAHRYGIKRVIIPERNLKDLAEVPSAILSGLEVTTIYLKECLCSFYYKYYI